LNRTETLQQRPYRVKLIGVLATAAGKRELEIVDSGEVLLSELIAKLVQHIGKPQFTDLLMDSATNSPLPNVILLVNDQDCRLFGGLKTLLDRGTTVTIIPVAHGG
jgi:molybdopterin converting factor small subunit